MSATWRSATSVNAGFFGKNGATNGAAHFGLYSVGGSTWVPIRMEQEPGSSGKAVVEHYATKVLVGYDFKGVPSTGDKATRAMPVASAAEFGNVHLVEGPWNAAFVSEFVAFPAGRHDDQVDPASLAFQEMARTPVYGLAVD
jgi:predicted phage terminase large subunit-like protein